MWLWLWLLFGAVAAWLVVRVLRAAGGRGAGTGTGDQRTDRGREDDGPGNPAVLGPDQTAINPPESYVIHHEGKGHGMDIATRALRELTRDIRRDVPGHTPVRAPVPGRALIIEEDLIGTAQREGGPDLAEGAGDRADSTAAAPPPGTGPGGTANGMLEDGTAGRRLATSTSHTEAAAGLAYPYRPAPFVGENKRETSRRLAAGNLEQAQEEIRGRVLDMARRLRRVPQPSHPRHEEQDPARGGSAENPPPGPD